MATNDNLIQRQRSVHFITKHIKGITHAEILDQIERTIEIDCIEAVQITERDCIVTVNDHRAKIKLLVEGVEVQNQHLKCMDVEKEITNITIKEAPVELADITICTYMSQFGDVVQGSIKRGTIKGTNIETGTRYIQIVNCDPTIPNLTTFGRFNVRLFADNNRTACRHCNRTDHPSYKCDKKQDPLKTTRSCYRCNSTEHMIRDCPYSTNVCYGCGREGHIKRDCTYQREYTETTEQDMYGDYVHDIREGRRADEDDEKKIPTKPDRTKQNTSTKDLDCEGEPNFTTTNTDIKTTTVIIGASNCRRVQVTDPNICNLSISGTTAENIDAILENVDCKLNTTEVSKIIFSLGTNDVTSNKNDHDMINVHVSNAVNKMKACFPNAEIGLCSILPRKGKGPGQVKCNLTSSSVNNFMGKLCSKDHKLSYIDLWYEFAPNNNPSKILYDANDPSGVHVSPKGVSLLSSIFCDFSSENEHAGEYQTPNRKRTRSSTSTPGSAERQLGKIQKS